MCDYERFVESELQKEKLDMKDAFGKKLEDCFKIFPEYWNKKYPENKLDFTHEVAVREFIQMVKTII